MSLGNLTHGYSEIAFVFITGYVRWSAMMQLADTLGNQHGGKIAISDLSDSGIEEFVLCRQVAPPDPDNALAILQETSEMLE